MLAVVLATAASRALGTETIYTLKLQRRGVTLHAPNAPSTRLRARQVGSVMVAAPATVPGDLPASELTGALSQRGVVLVQDQGTVQVVTAHALADALTNDEDALARDLAQAVPRLPLTTSLHEALEALLHDDGTGAAVVDDTGEVVGWVDHQCILSDLTGVASRAVSAPASRG
jgi:CIC family chloride channel protein